MGRWCERGGGELASVEADAEPVVSEAPFIELYLDVKQALGDFELQCLARVQTSPAGQWQRYGWVLERRFGYIASERRDIIVHDEPAIDPQKLLGTTDPDEADEAGTDDAMG